MNHSFHEYTGAKVCIVVTDVCNTSCLHCYMKTKGNIPHDLLLEIIEHLEKRYELHLYGAEIILRHDIFPLLKRIGQTSIITNGLELLCNPSICTLLKLNNITDISISYHIGIHEVISSIPSVKVEEAIKILLKNNFNVKIMTTITAQNHKNVLEICKKALSLGVSKIKFTNYINSKQIPNSNFVLNREQIESFFRQLYNARTIYSKDILTINRCATFGVESAYPSKFCCPAKSNLVVLGADLLLYRCLFDMGNENAIGCFKEGKLLIKSYEDIPLCKCYVQEKYNFTKKSLI